MELHRMAKPGVAFLLLLILAGSCNGDGRRNEDRIVLSSVFDFTSATTRGYNFEENTYTSFPSSGEPLPDIIIENFKRVDAPPEPGFTTPSNNHGFAMVGEFEDISTAESFFNGYKEFDTSLPMSATTDTVRLFQVYVLRTRLDNYARILVREIENFSDMSGEYVEVTIDYVYQDDGTAVFP